MEAKKLIEQKKLPPIMMILFWIIFYVLLLQYFDKEVILEEYKQNDFYHKYTLYSPIVFAVLFLIFFYILVLIKIIIRLKKPFFTLLAYLLSFGFFLALWIDFMFFEPADADFAKTIVATFSVPLIASSGIMIVLSALICLKKAKQVKEK